MVAGECGEDKREIVYFGDTVNLTARIEGMCETLGRQVVVSEDLLEKVSLPSDLSVGDLGAHQLRGSSRSLHLFEVTRKRQT